VFKIKNSVQNYEWGKRDWLPRFLGEENPQNQPWAELWMGAHPKAPSRREEDGAPLDRLIRSEGSAFLGDRVYSRYRRLPFLFKVLAVEAPLSIQVHPSIEQAREGFARENGRDIPLDAFNRNYRDDNHKPEIICAVTPYTAMKGFRSFEEIKENFRRLGSFPGLNLFTGGGIKDFYLRLMGLNGEDRGLLLTAAASLDNSSSMNRWVKKLMGHYPGDVSALSPFFLNLIELKEGEALYLPSGELHAYLSGVGIELMANSDNVLRGGLTPKFMDLGELERVVRFVHSPVRILKKENNDYYYSGVEEFRLGEKSLSGNSVLDTGNEAAILLVFEGNLRIEAGGASLEAGRGDAVFLPWNCGKINLSGEGRVFWSTVRREE
jgi:mannose-6-phosphate isomerase